MKKIKLTETAAEWCIVFISLLFRFLAWFWVISHETQLYCDERGYFNRAKSWSAALDSLIHGNLPDASTCDTLYGFGVWPPLHTLLLSFGGMVSGIDGVRFIPVIFSAATTLLIMKLARKCGFSSRTALFAGLLHAVYPEYIAFSHYLWSETTFSFFLLAGMVSALSSSSSPDQSWKRYAYAILSGTLLGLGTLCRVTVLPVMALLAGWWFFPAISKYRKTGNLKPFIHEIIRTSLLCGVFLTLITPWMLVLKAREGKWMPLSTSGGYNLYLGNHPATPEGLGSAWGMFKYHGGAAQQISDYVSSHANPAEIQDSQIWVFSRNELCRKGAMEEIHARPVAAVKRIFLRAGTLFAPDIFMIRHIVNMVYYPMSNMFAAMLIILNTLFWFTVLLGTIISIWSGEKPGRYWILTSSAFLLIIPALITISVSRMRFVSTLLILPLCAHGLINLAHIKTALIDRTRKTGAVLLFAVAMGLSIHFYRLTMLNFTIPSSHYTPIIRVCSKLGMMQPLAVDTFALTRSQNGPNRIVMELPLHPENYLSDMPELSQMQLPLPQPNRIKPFIIVSKMDSPITFQWSLPQIAKPPPTVFEPGEITKEWRPTGLPGLLIRAQGANYRKGIWKDSQHL